MARRRPQMKNLVWRVFAVLLGGLFVYAGAIKLVDPMHFAIDIDNYKMLSWAVSVRLAFYLPWLEIFCGIAVIFRLLYRGGLSILAALIATFIVASIIAKGRGLDISCGCFGEASKYLSFTWHLALDFILLALALLLFRHDCSRLNDSQARTSAQSIVS
jgi:putative oxidoreductase